MRVVPVGLIYFEDEAQGERVAISSSKVTHPHQMCGMACALYTKLVSRAMRGSSKDELVSLTGSFDFKDANLNSRFQPYKSTAVWIAQDMKNIKSTGYVIDSLEASLWGVFYHKIVSRGCDQSRELR